MSATMSVRHLTFAATATLALLLSACGDSSKIPEQQSTGPQPQIPEPTKSLIPTVKVAKATGWGADGKPAAAAGLTVTAFARGLDHPRWVYRAAERRRAGRGKQRAGAARARQGHQGPRHEMGAV